MPSKRSKPKIAKAEKTLRIPTILLPDVLRIIELFDACQLEAAQRHCLQVQKTLADLRIQTDATDVDVAA